MLHGFHDAELEWLGADQRALASYALVQIYGGLLYLNPCPRVEFPSGRSVEVHTGLRRDAVIEYLSPGGFLSDLAVLLVPDRDLESSSDIRVLEVSGWCSQDEFFSKAGECDDGNLVLGHPELNTANSFFTEVWSGVYDSSGNRSNGGFHHGRESTDAGRGLATFAEYYPVP